MHANFWSFIFTELKKYLIRYHSRNNSSLPLGPCLDLEDSGLWDLYVRPNISRVDLQSIHRDKKSMERTTEPLTNLEQLFSSKGIIFLTADAGVGKTSFCKFLVLSWCKVQEGTTDLKSKVSGTQTGLSDIEYLKEFTYLFYINIRENHCDTLEDIIFSHTEYVYTKLTKDNQAFYDMLSNENGLFILDGLDEWSIPSIKPLAENRKYTVLITSRPWKLANINMPSKYTHAKIQVLQQDESKQLVFRANNCLNKHFKTSYEIGDFLDAIKTRFVESQLENPMFALQLLCVYHDKRSKNTTDPGNTRQGVSTYLGKTKSHIYANMIELMFRSVEKKEEPLVQTHNLPECFGERNYTCSSLAKLINAIGKLAAYSLLDDHKSFIQERQIRELKKKEKMVLLKSGLLSETSLNTLSEKRNVYTFLHQTYREMLACVFLSSQDFESDIWRKFRIEFKSVMSPEMLSFLCVMNYKQGCECLDKFNEKKLLFQRGGFSLLFELLDYQTTMTMAHKECSDNGIKKPQIRLRHALLDPDIGIRTDHALLKESGLELETLFISDYSVTTVIEPNLFTNSLAHLQVHDATFHADHIVLSDCTQLLTIELWNTHISHLTINPSRLEMFSVTTKSKLIQEMPPMRVSFVSGSQFSSNLKELSLVHVTMDVPLDLANCQQLQRFVIKDSSSDTMTDIGVVCNMQRCDALQELRPDTLPFPADTHLDLSGLAHLSKITIQNTRLSRVTFNPSCLEEFWVYVNDELIQEIPPMKLAFVGGSQFSSNLKKLSLVHVTMDVPLDLANCQQLQQLVMNITSSDTMTDIGVVCNMQRCDVLKELRPHTLPFHADTHLDLSGLGHLSKITIQNTRLSRVTINPFCLEEFWVYVNDELIQEIPPMKLSFVGGSQFSSNLKKLSLVHVIMDVPLDLANCQQLQQLFMNNISSDTMTDIGGVCNMQRCDALQELRLGTLTFPADTHLDFSGHAHLSKITIQNTRLSRVTINPSCLEEFLVAVKPELISEMPRMKLSFVGRSQFSSNLKNLSLVHVTMDVPLDLANCQQLQQLFMNNISSDTMTDIGVVCNMQRCDALQELRLGTLTFPADTHLDFSGHAHLSKITIQNTRLSRVTINPSCLEEFLVAVKPELISEMPRMKLSFVGGSQFSSNLKNLSLVHVTMDVPLDLANCQQLQQLFMNNTSSDTMTDIGGVCNMQRCDALQELVLDTLTFPVDTHLDFSGHAYLSKITIQNTRLSRVTINPSCLEEFLVAVKPELISEMPRMKLSFVGGSQFSSNLKNLSLVHVTMEVSLDLANCQQLQQLLMKNTSSNTMTDIGGVCNMQRCDALQELVFDTLTFPVDTHLDFSGLAHLSKITIYETRLSRVTTNPSCLEEFLVAVKTERIQEIPPIKLSFVGGSQFSSNLKELSLVHVTMDVPLDLANCQQLQLLVMDNTSSDSVTGICVVRNMQRCDALQELVLDTLTFPADTHLDLSEFTCLTDISLVTLTTDITVQFPQNVHEIFIDGVTFRKNTHLDLSGLAHLSKITIQETRLSHVTINPSCLEKFWVAVKPELIQEIPPMKLSFVGGSKFSRKLTMLSLVHKSNIHSVDLSECVQLQTLRTGHSVKIGTLGLPRLEEIRLFGAQTEVCNNVLQCISEGFCPCRRIWFENLSTEIFSSLTVSRTYAEKFETFKFRLMCLDINVFDFIKTAAVEKVEFEEVKVKAQQLVALLTCTEPIQDTKNTGGGMVELPVGLCVSDISFFNCPFLCSTKEEVESAIECLRRVWEIKEVNIETQQSSISNTVCGEDIISETQIVLKSLQMKSN